MARKDCWRALVVCLVLGLGTVALYSPAFTFGFLNPSDALYVTANPHVNRGLTATGMGWAFQTAYAANWHPMTWLSHMVDCQVFGPKAGGHHAINVLLHALNSVLLFLLLRRMTGAFWRSAAVAAFFAWHPLNVESVAWISERKGVLSAFFWLLTLWAYVRYVELSKALSPMSKAYYLGALVCFALGLMAKPMLVTLPFVLLLLDWWPLGRLQLAAESGAGAPPPVRKRLALVVVEKIPFFLLAIASSVVTLIAAYRQVSVSITAQLPFRLRFVQAGVTCFRYLVKTVWPTDLGATYPLILHRPKVELIIIALVLVGISVFALRLWKLRPFWLVGWLWFLGVLFPVLNLAQAGAQPMADRYMYLPSIGLFILICWDACDLAQGWARGRVMLGGLCAAALAACCIATSFQLQYWKNEGTLVAHIAQPDYNYLAHANYAAYLMTHNQLAEAQAQCEKAIAIAPGFVAAQALLGEILRLQGKLDLAIETLRSALKANPDLMDAEIPLGRALLAKNRPTEAEAAFRTLLRNNPRNIEAYDWLGWTLLKEGKMADAMAEFNQSLALQPNQPITLNDLAWIFATSPRAELRNGAEAVHLATRACELTHNTQFVFLGTLAASYAEAGRFDDAVATAQKAHDLAAAENNTNGASRNLELLKLYQSHQPFHEKP